MASKFGIWRQKIQQHPVVTVVIIAAIVIGIALIVVIVLGYLYHWNWTGLNGGYSKITRKNVIVDGKPADADQALAKNLWDWWQLLAVVAIPVVVGFGAAWFTAQHGKVSERENKDNQREKALQDYIDKMSELLLDRHLRESSLGDEVRTIARVRTITVLTQLNVRRISYVFTFLREAELMSTTSNSSVVSLKDADLRAVKWSQADLRGAHLNRADLRGAYLNRADLRRAYLRGADLRGATLRGATLSEADLSISKTNLRGADLSNATLSGANLSGASLRGANLSEADLSGAHDLTQEQLDQVYTCKGAILPKGLTCHNNP